MRDKIKTLAAALILLVQSRPGALAQDDFEFFEEQDKVITASRRPQSIQESPVAVDVITAEEIASSKVTNLWDLLRFRVGTDVIDIRSATNNRAAVSVRGFPSEFVSSLQVLVDGRSVYGGPSSGVYWEQVPVQIQDIERIEIVRGPNAALYGSNSGFGVINILTKKPEASAASAGILAGSPGIWNMQSSVQGVAKAAGIRVSHTYHSSDGFVDGAGDKTNDALNSNKANLRAFWKVGGKNVFDFFAGASHDDLGQASSGTPGETDSHSHFEMLRYTHSFGADSSIEITGSRRDEILGVDSRQYQYDGEALHRFSAWGGRSNTVWGGSYRYIKANDPLSYSPQTAQQKEIVSRGFVQETWRPVEKLILSGAFSIERSQSAETEPAYQAAVVSPLSPQHTLRASYALSPTLPALFEERANGVFPPIAFDGNVDVDAAHVTSYELSHLGNFAGRKVDTELTLFYMLNRDVRRVVPTFQTFSPIFLQHFSFRNDHNAIARGVEAKTRYRFQANRYVYANYTHEHISADDGSGELSETTPEHKVNVGAFVHVWDGLSVGMDAGYKSGYDINSIYLGNMSVPAYTRLDTRLIYKSGRWEFFVVGQNLTRPWHQEFTPALNVPRTYYGGMSVEF
jgi:iron complex outermembrane receptor protein